MELNFIRSLLTKYKLTEAELPNWKLPGYVSPAEHKKLLNDIIDESFEDILTAYKQSLPEPNILKHDNSTTGDGRHISPGIVNITDVIAVNLTCDVIDGSYSASDNSIMEELSFLIKPKYTK